ncbi:MAG: PAS domain S-box protein [Verrucomicrobiota bacterium]
MMPSTLPSREGSRLAALHSYEVLDTLPEESLDDLTKLAAHICGVPTALISLIDENRQWFKSRVGLEVVETPLDVSFCLHAIQKPGLFIVPDASKDARFAQNPLVMREPHIRFYAGTSLISPEGQALGTLCVIDHRPRNLTSEQEEALRVLGRQVMIQLETRRQNRALLASQAERADILASAMDAIVVMDGQGIIREFNPAAEIMFGWTAESVIGQLLAEVIVPPALRQRHGDGLRHRLKTGEGPIAGQRSELMALRADGSVFPVELSVMRSRGHGPPMFIGFMRDISVRQAAEEALRESEERFRGTFEQAAVGIAHICPEGRFLWVNDKLCGILGYTREELLGRISADFTVPQDHVAAQEARRCMLAGERASYTLEKRYRRKSGEQIWVNLIATLERTGSGDPKYFTHVSEDITARKLVEVRLRRLNRLHTVLSKIGGAIVRTPGREPLYAAVCRILVEDGLLRMAFIAEVDPEDGFVHPVAGCGVGLQYLDGLTITTDDSCFSQGSVGTVMRTGVHDVCNDFAADPRMLPWRDRAALHGFLATAAFPLKLGGTTIGALVLFSAEAGYFQEDEVRLMVDVANSMSFALEAQRREQRREQAVSALRASTTDLIRAQRIAHLGSWVHTLATGRLQWSEETYRIFGVDASSFAVSYESFLLAVHPEDRDRLREAHQRAISGAGGLDTEHRVVRPDGTWRWVHELGELEWDSGGQPIRLTGTTLDITLRKTASRALEWSEGQLRALAAQLQTEQARLVEAQALAKVGSWETGLTTMDVIWSEEVYRICGKDPAHFKPTHQGFLNIVHPEDLEMVHQAFLQSLGQSSACTLEHRLLLPDGRIKFVEECWQSICDARGMPRRVFGTCRDVTEPRKVAAEAQRTSALLRAVADGTPDSVFVKDLSGCYLLMNEAGARLAGRPVEDILGKDDTAIFGTEGARITMQSDHRVMISDRPHTTEEVLTAAGVTRTYLATKAPYRDERGNVVGMIGISRDITERKEAMERIAEQAALIDEARDAIYVRDLDHRITFWSKGAERLFGWTAEAALGRLVREVLPVTPEEFAEADRAIRAAGVWQGELRFTSRAGAAVTLDSRWTLMRDARGEPKSILTIDTDITESRNLRQQFLRSQRMESIGTLAGGIAHDLNNALAPIIMSLDLLKMRFPDEESMDLLGIIRSSAQRGADMVRQVLSFARGVEGRHEVVRIPPLVEEVAKIANETFLKHIRIETTLAAGLWTVMGDPTQLHQVLLNLCVNARDAMPQGGTLTISAENVSIDEQYAGLYDGAQPGSHLLLQVEDTGTGMPPGLIEKIFDPFFTTKELGKGTGLGLSTSIAILKSHGGFMRVESTVGVGSRFKIYLPAQVCVDTDSLVSEGKDLPRGHGELILVVDDELRVREITQQTLEAFGYRVVLANDGADAVAVYASRSSEISAVLTDMMMPVMDGPTAILVLRRLNPHLPILAASGLAIDEHVAKVASLGVKHFLPKPYTAQALLVMLQELIGAGTNPLLGDGINAGDE